MSVVLLYRIQFKLLRYSSIKADVSSHATCVSQTSSPSNFHSITSALSVFYNKVEFVKTTVYYLDTKITQGLLYFSRDIWADYISSIQSICVNQERILLENCTMDFRLHILVVVATKPNRE